MSFSCSPTASKSSMNSCNSMARSERKILAELPTNEKKSNLQNKRVYFRMSGRVDGKAV